jgi:hypothetical protein
MSFGRVDLAACTIGYVQRSFLVFGVGIGSLPKKLAYLIVPI